MEGFRFWGWFPNPNQLEIGLHALPIEYHEIRQPQYAQATTPTSPLNVSNSDVR